MGKTLDFKMQRQQLSLWCWAAVAASVCDFYSDSSYGSQCLFVSNEIPGNFDCCVSARDDGEGSVCNRAMNLGDALWDCHHGLKVDPDPADFSMVVEQLNEGHPIACNVHWKDDTVHALVIHGYTDDGTMLIADPEKPGTLVSINRDFIYSTTYEAGAKAGNITELFRTL
jgi:hypothetical protein